MNERERLLSQTLKRVELVAWSGTVDALALRLNMRTDKLIEALQAKGVGLFNAKVGEGFCFFRRLHNATTGRSARARVGP